MELLEKRVKSRFSHRQILLFPHTEFDDYVSLVRSLLTLPDDFEDSQYRQQWQENIEVCNMCVSGVLCRVSSNSVTCTEATGECISSADFTEAVQNLSRCQESPDTTSKDRLTHSIIPFTNTHKLWLH